MSLDERADLVLHPADLARPVPALFGRPAPLVLEIGFGDGEFLAHLAESHPHWNLLGAEISLSSAERAFRRLRREGLQNARLYRGHARFLLRDILPDGSVHRIYVNFPDPWPKKRHAGRRLLRAPFLRLAAARLEPGGRVLLTTDHPDYFAMALDEARATGLFDAATGPPPPAALRTKYARKWQAQAIPIHHASFTRTAPPETTILPQIERLDAMHHAFLQGTLPDLDAFDRQVHAFDGGHVILLEAFSPVGRLGLLLNARIEEPDFTQEVLVEARPDAGGTTYVGIKLWGQPLATRGTREAVRAVVRWLETRGLQETARFY